MTPRFLISQLPEPIIMALNWKSSIFTRMDEAPK